MLFRKAIETLERRTLFTAGDFDPSFGLGGVASVAVPPAESNQSIHAIDVAPSGRIVIGGAHNSDAMLAVFDSARNPPQSFRGDGVETEALANDGEIIDLFVQSDNKVVVLAQKSFISIGFSGQAVLARFNTNGSLDTTFGGGDGQVVLPEGSAVAPAPNGRIVVVGV